MTDCRQPAGSVCQQAAGDPGQHSRALRPETPWLLSAVNALHALTGLLTLAVFLLLVLLLQRNFQVKYVANYTSLSQPTVYVLSAVWAGQEGSLLLWGWLLSVCSSVFLWKNTQGSLLSRLPQLLQGTVRPRLKEDEQAYISIAFALVLGFFLVLLLFMANPFDVLDFMPRDGKGMNPLLQNLYMVVHPPVLFIGYAGFIVPFALAFAMLGRGTLEAERLDSLRRWILFSWYFLGMGILLGAHWAYLELGWGGYWSWDPVENASLIPWLTATALLHTLALQRRNGVMALWNMFLCILTFSLCIFAAFVTRSGILASVHSFSQSVTGYSFLTFLACVFTVTAALFAVRWNTFRTRSLTASLFSKESSVFFANQLFMGLTAAVMYGTLYPFCLELFFEKKVTLSTVFFNRISVPVGLTLLVLMGVCQRIPWKKQPFPRLAGRLLAPGASAFAISAVLYAVGIRHGFPLVTCGTSVFVVLTMLLDVGETLMQRVRHPSPKKSYRRAILTSLLPKRRLYAAYIVHLGIVVMYPGIAVSSAYTIEQNVVLQPGESAAIGDFRFRYGHLNMVKDSQKTAVMADVTVFRTKQQIAALTPQKHFYGEGDDAQMTTEIGLHSTLQRDIYVILAGWDDEDTATFRVIIHPMILWIWIGGFVVCTLGMLVWMIPRRVGEQI